MTITQPAPRRRLAFQAINRPGAPDYDPGLQRHHLLPRQLLSQRCFAPMFEALRPARIGFDDFRINGMLLPASDAAALRMAMPLHRGPHRRYNCMVIERVGRIEANWTGARLRRGLESASDQALMQLWLVQCALRRRLLRGGAKHFTLNRADPIGRTQDFSELDAMADLFWAESFAAQLAASRVESSAFAA